jgi:hypothetical protein
MFGLNYHFCTLEVSFCSEGFGTWVFGELFIHLGTDGFGFFGPSFFGELGASDSVRIFVQAPNLKADD